MVMFWVLLLAVSILLYVLLDGADLGIGMLFGLTRGEEKRRAMLSATSSEFASIPCASLNCASAFAES